MTNIRIEAEQMALSGYSKETASFASGGQLIRIPNDGTSGTATTSFSGAAGTYALKVVYHDESDGESRLAVKVNNGTSGYQVVDDWTFSEATNDTRASASNRRERIISNVNLTTNSQIQLEGFLHSGEVARVDYIELVPVEITPPINTPPVARNDVATTTADTPTVIDVLSNDSDAEGDPISLSTFDNVTSHGSVSLNENGTLTYTPSAGYSGSDSFSYSIRDGRGGSGTGTVAVTVNAAPVTPPSNGSATSMKIEAEQMALLGYVKETASFASGGQLIRIPNDGTSGTATTSFSGTPGTYALKVVYHDESDGKSRLIVRVKNGADSYQVVDEFTFSEATNNTRADASNRRERVIPNVALTSNSQIQLEGFLHSGEVARVDYIELVPNAAPPPGGFPSETNAKNGLILNLNTGVGLAPLFGALGTPRLMPLGDSITAGEHSSGAYPGAYRRQFWNRAVADDLSLDFVGSQSNGPSSLGDRDHAGFPGRKITEITNWVNSGNLAKYPTDAILLGIGTNDANSGVSGSQMRDRLNTLIDAITAKAPNTYLYVTSISPVDAPRGTASEAKSVADYNALIPALVAEKASQGKRVSFVNAGGSLSVGDINGDNSSTNDVNDGLHPTAAGYDKLGNAWYSKVFNPTSLAGKTDLSGSRFDDRLIGNSNNNFLVGGGGRDELTGGGGADVFGYKSISDGGDKIMDFSSDDRLRISAAGFGGDLFAGIRLDSSSFIKGSDPVTSGSKSAFLYSTGNSTLSFDRDGLGSFGAVAIATLTNGFNLQATQIDIVA